MENDFLMEDVEIEFTEEKIATRAASGKVLNVISRKVSIFYRWVSRYPASSNKTTIMDQQFMKKERIIAQIFTLECVNCNGFHCQWVIITRWNQRVFWNFSSFLKLYESSNSIISNYESTSNLSIYT